MPPNVRDIGLGWCSVLSLALALALGSCGSGRLLADDEYLVRRNRIELAEGTDVENWAGYALELYNQVEPQRNGRLLFLFRRERIYLRSIRKDSTRFRGFVRRILAERPAYLDSALVAGSARRIQGFVRNRGYFDATVAAEIDTTGAHSARVTYTVSPGRVYRFDTVSYEAANPAIAALVEQTRDQRILRAGVRVDGRLYDQEVARLVSLMRDNGFADFYANSIPPLEADSAGGRIGATLRILPPAEGERHRVSRIGQVTVFPDSDPLAFSQTVSIDTSYDGLRFIYEDDRMRVLPDALAENIFLRPGELFDQSAITKTNLQLNLLGVFRLVNIQQIPSTDTEGEIDFFIQCTPAKRRAYVGEPNVNFTERLFGGSNLALLGTQVSSTLSDNNVFGGAERLTVGLDAGLEFNIGQLRDSSLQRLNTVELGLQTALELPRFVDFFGLYRGLHRFRTGTDDDGAPIRFVSDGFYQALRERGLSRLRLGARYTSQLNLFTENLLSANLGYTLTRGWETWTLNHVALEYLQYSFEAPFRAILERSPALERSFMDQVFTAVLLRGIQYARVRTREPSGSTWTWLVDAEQSGAELQAINAITNTITGARGPYLFGPGLDYARYGRLSVSVSEARPISLRETVAWRLATGAALPFGYARASRDVPYQRQFFVGGANSLRGWATRDLGPGGYVDSVRIADPDNSIPYQQADLRLEANLELRGPLGKVSTTKIDYAVFVDAGNIWTLRPDSTRPMSQFALRRRYGPDDEVVAEPFYRQIAINTGLGIRWDVKYALLRFDVGVKLRNPYPIDGSYWPRRFDDYLNGRFGFGLGLNYPF